MKNPFSFFSKPRGLPDSTVHHGGEGHHDQHYNQLQTNAFVPPSSQTLIQAPAPIPLSQAIVPAGYPAGSGGYGYNNYPSAVGPPSAYPYAAQQEKEAEAAWEFNAGNNVNIKGQQKAGHIKVGNTGNGAPMPINLPQNGRFVFNAGGNTNEGDMQEVGNIEFGNVRPN